MKSMISAAFGRALPLLLVLGPACDPGPDPEPMTTAASASETGSGSEDTGSASETGSVDTGSGETGTASVDTGSGETGSGPATCSAATTAEECAAVDNEFEDCGWFETSQVSDPATCEAVEPSGACLPTSVLDGCGEIFASDACEADGGPWVYRTLESGAIELLHDPPLCIAGLYEPCPYFMEEPADDTIAAICACACTIAAG